MTAKRLKTGGFATFGLSLALLTVQAGPAHAEDIKVVCPNPLPKIPEISRADVYRDSPFKSGETAVYEVSWGGLKAGDATLDVRPPRKHQDVWHRVFHVEAKTGDWFKAIFIAKEEVEAVTRPWDFGVSKFFMEQDEGKIFGRRFQQKKWLDFDHNNCKVKERVVEPDKAEKTSTFDLSYGANDALGVLYNLRARNFRIGQKERAPVYTSEKNWWLEADPIAFEKVTVPAGTYDTVKLKLQTFIGKELQQKGDVWAWIATNVPERPMVQVQGEIKIGSVWIKLNKFKPGSP